MPKKIYPVTAEFRAGLKRRLDELAWSHSDLARKISATPAQISAVLQADQSELVPAIEAALGWRDASSEHDDEDGPGPHGPH